MEIGSEEHRKEAFEKIQSSLQEDIWLNDWQRWGVKKHIQTLQDQKAEAEKKLENKEFPSAGEGRNEIKRIQDGILQAISGVASLESQRLQARQRLEEVKAYAKEQGWEADKIQA